MMGWMAALRHLGANAGWSKPISEQGAIHERGHMTASDQCAARQIISCQAGAIHT